MAIPSKTEAPLMYTLGRNRREVKLILLGQKLREINIGTLNRPKDN